MARIRTVKPEFWTDEKIVECSISARLLFVGLFNFADDRGCLERSPKRIKMQVFPADTIDCEPLLNELIAHGLLTEYSVNGSQYLLINGFLKHQRINRPSKTNIPLPPGITECSVPGGGGVSESSLSTQGTLTEDSLTEGKGREGKDIKPVCVNTREDSVDNAGQTEWDKFRMHADWQPEPGFADRARGWGHALADPPFDTGQLQKFRDYWTPEPVLKRQQQWEIALAESLSNQKNIRGHPRRRSDVNAIPTPDDTIPSGFRGNNPALEADRNDLKIQPDERPI
jgi:hypothetical protein